MDNTVQKILYSILLVPLIGLLLYSISEPEKHFMFGRRWMYKNDDVEPSEKVIKINKLLSIVMLITIVFVYLFYIFS